MINRERQREKERGWGGEGDKQRETVNTREESK